MTGKGPSWLKLKRAKQKWEFVPDKVKVVQRIFQLAHEGHGQNKIAHILNAEGVVQGAEWSSSDAGKAYGKKHRNFFEGKLVSQKTGARYPLSERPEYLIQLTFTKSTRLLDATSLVSPTTITKHKMTHMKRQRAAKGG